MQIPIFNAMALLDGYQEGCLPKSNFFQYRFGKRKPKLVHTRAITRYNLIYRDYELSNGIQYISSNDNTDKKYCILLHNLKFQSLSELSRKESEKPFQGKKLLKNGWLFFCWENADNIDALGKEFHLIVARADKGKVTSVYFEGYNSDINKFNGIINDILPDVQRNTFEAAGLIGLSDEKTATKDV